MSYTSRTPLVYTLLYTGIPVFKWDMIFNSTQFKALSGTWALLAEPNDYLGQNLSNNATHGVNEVVALGTVFIPESTDYTAYAITQKTTDGAKLHIRLNGSDKGEIDMYGAGLYNQVQSVSLGTLTKGYYDLDFKLSDKNGASSNYYCHLQGLMIIRTV